MQQLGPAGFGHPPHVDRLVFGLGDALASGILGLRPQARRGGGPLRFAFSLSSRNEGSSTLGGLGNVVGCGGGGLPANCRALPDHGAQLGEDWLEFADCARAPVRRHARARRRAGCSRRPEPVKQVANSRHHISVSLTAAQCAGSESLAPRAIRPRRAARSTCRDFQPRRPGRNALASRWARVEGW